MVLQNEAADRERKYLIMLDEVLMFGSNTHMDSMATHRQSGQWCFADRGGASDWGGHRRAQR